VETPRPEEVTNTFQVKVCGEALHLVLRAELLLGLGPS